MTGPLGHSLEKKVNLFFHFKAPMLGQYILTQYISVLKCEAIYPGAEKQITVFTKFEQFVVWSLLSAVATLLKYCDQIKPCIMY